MDSENQVITCSEHGTSPSCFICSHLLEREGLVYWAIPAEPAEPAQAWCEACDQVLEQEQGWNDRADAQAGWRLCCTTCFEQSLRAHELRGWVEGSSPEE